MCDRSKEISVLRPVPQRLSADLFYSLVIGLLQTIRRNFYETFSTFLTRYITLANIVRTDSRYNSCNSYNAAKKLRLVLVQRDKQSRLTREINVDIFFRQFV